MRSLLERLDRYLAALSKAADYIAAGLLVLLTLDVFAEVIFRYALNAPLRFSSEVALIIFPWIVFMSAVRITQLDNHIGIVVFRHAQKGVRRKILETFIYLTMAAFSAVMLFAGWNLAMGLTQNILPITGISRAFLYISVPVSFAAIMLIVMVRVAQVVMADFSAEAGPPDNHEDEEPGDI